MKRPETLGAIAPRHLKEPSSWQICLKKGDNFCLNGTLQEAHAYAEQMADFPLWMRYGVLDLQTNFPDVGVYRLYKTERDCRCGYIQNSAGFIKRN